jgi:hypothetical protein
VVEPLLWLLTAGLLATASARVVVQREQWWRPYLVAVGATVALPGLLFWQPPIALSAVVDGVLLRALIGSRRPRPPPPASSTSRHRLNRIASAAPTNDLGVAIVCATAH